MTNQGGSWTDLADIVYLDQPVGTGFSYGNSYITSMDEIGEEFLQFMRAFLAKYPEYRARDIYIAGESYAGKYIPLFATKLLGSSDFKDIKLKSLIISNPLASPLTQRLVTYNLAKGLNYVDGYHLG